MKKNINKKSETKFWEVFWFIIKITFLGFGGGNAIFPIIKKEAVEKKQWITNEILDDIIILTNSLPGASVIEAVSFISIKMLGKVKGVLVTIIGLIPHILLFFGFFILGMTYIPNEYLMIIFVGVIPVIIALLTNLTYRYIKLSKKEFSYPVWISIFLISFSFNFFVPSPFNIPAIVIVIFLIGGIIFEFFSNKKKKEKIITYIPYKLKDIENTENFKKEFNNLKSTNKRILFLSNYFIFEQPDYEKKFEIVFKKNKILFKTTKKYIFENGRYYA